MKISHLNSKRLLWKLQKILGGYFILPHPVHYASQCAWLWIMIEYAQLEDTPSNCHRFIVILRKHVTFDLTKWNIITCTVIGRPIYLFEQVYAYTTPWAIKTCHFVFDYNSGISLWNFLNTFYTKKTREGRLAYDRRPNVLVGFLDGVVSFCQVWFGSVHICWRYGWKIFPEYLNVIIQYHGFQPS